MVKTNFIDLRCHRRRLWCSIWKIRI